MLPYPDPRMYAGGVPGYYDPMAGRPPPSAAEFYAAAAVSLLACISSAAHTVQMPHSCQPSVLTPQGQAVWSTGQAAFLCPAALHKQSAQ